MTWDMIGHQWAVSLLRKHISAKQVRHAYLISGDEGVGKRTLAVQFARALNCLKDGASGTYCGVCRACTLIPEHTFPDFHVLEPEEGTNSFKIDQVRELQQQLALSPYEGRWRIALLADFERATENAANALLKTLEEPSDKVIIILTATDTSALLPTIVSRCEQIALRAVSKDEIGEAIGKSGLTEVDVRLIAGIAQGRPGAALRYATEPEMLEGRLEQIDQLETLLQSSKGERFDYVDRLLSRRDELEQKRQLVLKIMQTWMGLWRDAMLRSCNPASGIVNMDQEALVNRLVAGVSKKKIQECVTAIQRTQRAIEDFANVRLAMEVLMLDFPLL